MRLAIFDLDGTLINSLEDLSEACNVALRSFGFPPHPAEAYKLFIGNGVYKLIERCVPPQHRTPETLAQVFEVYNDYYTKHGEDKTRPFPGMTETVQVIREYGVKTAVLTNKPHKLALPMVNSLFPGLFDLILGQRDGVPTKPNPTAVEEIIRHFGVLKSDCCFIGDSSVDILTGKAAGLFTVGVTWGYRTKEELESAGADLILHKVEDLTEVLVDKGSVHPLY